MLVGCHIGGPIFIASPAGGTSIEDVAEKTPELIFKQPVDIMGTYIQLTYLLLKHVVRVDI